MLDTLRSGARALVQRQSGLTDEGDTTSRVRVKFELHPTSAVDAVAAMAAATPNKYKLATSASATSILRERHPLSASLSDVQLGLGRDTSVVSTRQPPTISRQLPGTVLDNNPFVFEPQYLKHIPAAARQPRQPQALTPPVGSRGSTGGLPPVPSQIGKDATALLALGFNTTDSKAVGSRLHRSALVPVAHATHLLRPGSVLSSVSGGHMSAGSTRSASFDTPTTIVSACNYPPRNVANVDAETQTDEGAHAVNLPRLSACSASTLPAVACSQHELAIPSQSDASREVLSSSDIARVSGIMNDMAVVEIHTARSGGSLVGGEGFGDFEEDAEIVEAIRNTLFRPNSMALLLAPPVDASSTSTQKGVGTAQVPLAVATRSTDGATPQRGAASSPTPSCVSVVSGISRSSTPRRTPRSAGYVASSASTHEPSGGSVASPRLSNALGPMASISSEDDRNLNRLQLIEENSRLRGAVTFVQEELRVLRREMETLEGKVDWRTSLLDYIKQAYHRDVFAIREHLFRLMTKLQAAEKRGVARIAAHRRGSSRGSLSGQEVTSQRRASASGQSQAGPRSDTPQPEAGKGDPEGATGPLPTPMSSARSGGYAIVAVGEGISSSGIGTGAVMDSLPSQRPILALERVAPTHVPTAAIELPKNLAETLHPGLLPSDEDFNALWSPAVMTPVESTANLRELMQLFGLHSVITALDKTEVDRLRKVEVDFKQLQGKYETLAKSSQALVERHAMLSDSATTLAARLDEADSNRRRAVAAKDALGRRIADSDTWAAMATANITALSDRVRELETQVLSMQLKRQVALPASTSTAGVLNDGAAIKSPLSGALFSRAFSPDTPGKQRPASGSATSSSLGVLAQGLGQSKRNMRSAGASRDGEGITGSGVGSGTGGGSGGILRKPPPPPSSSLKSQPNAPPRSPSPVGSPQAVRERRSSMSKLDSSPPSPAKVQMGGRRSSLTSPSRAHDAAASGGVGARKGADGSTSSPATGAGGGAGGEAR